MPDSLLTDDFKSTPYWWEAMTARQSVKDLPLRTDVVIVGAGLTGCSAAATLAAAGRDVVVIEQEQPGFGASTRNAGFIGRHFKHSLTDLLARFDVPTALSYFLELRRVFDFAIDLIKREQLNCALQENGRLVAAIGAANFDRLQREYGLRRQHLNEEFVLLSDAGQTEYRSAKVSGGVLLQEQAAIHPGLYAEAMTARAETAGATIVGATAVTRITSRDGGFLVSTERGEVRCRDVLVATNGYSGKAWGWLRRRLVPIRSYMIATEPLPKLLLEELLPNNRTYTDNRKASNYMRWSPVGDRIIFGGQTGAALEDRLDLAGLKVREELVGLFPQLRDVRISHAWTGRCAASVDVFPKIGRKEGIHFAVGYCFSGNALAPYLGHHAAKRILGDRGDELVFEAKRFPALPLYNGNAWFLPLVQRYLEWSDRRRR